MIVELRDHRHSASSFPMLKHSSSSLATSSASLSAPHVRWALLEPSMESVVYGIFTSLSIFIYFSLLYCLDFQHPVFSFCFFEINKRYRRARESTQLGPRRADRLRTETALLHLPPSLSLPLSSRLRNRACARL